MNDRARVPFAFVGILLLVSSVTLTTTGSLHDSPQRPAIDRAMEEDVSARLATALRSATADAATDSAAAPVTSTANTTIGRALNDTRPFRDALRLRLYLEARSRLAGLSVRREAVVVTASLPPVEPTTAGYRAAISRVHVEPAGTDDAALRVTVEGITLTASRNGQVVTRTERSPSFVVATPVLLLHDRTERFEARANAPVTDPGLGRRLTARLYPLVWTRGYAQYGGGPIANVLATRHVELAANDALLAEQRAVFDESDPAGRRAMATAGMRVGVTDVLAGTGGDAKRIDATLRRAHNTDAESVDGRPGESWRTGAPDAELTVDAATDADRAFADLVGIGSSDELSRVIEAVHTVQARVHTVVETRGVIRREDGSPPGSWTLVDRSTTRRVSLRSVGDGAPETSGWSTRDGAVFAGTVTESVTSTWRRDNETRTTDAVLERSVRVRVAIQARTVPISGAERGALDGKLAGATERATERTVRHTGGLREAASSAAVGNPPSGVVTVTVSPVLERAHVVAELRAVHDRVRNTSVTLPAPTVAGGRANPPRRLRDELAERRNDLLGPHRSAVANRTIRAAKTAYLDELDARLATRAERHARTNDGLVDAVGRYLDPDRFAAALSGHRPAVVPDRERLADPAGNLTVAIDTAPAYLSTGTVSRDRMGVRGKGVVRSLATRNVNVFVTPHGQVAKSILGRVPFLGTDRVSLTTAAETLAATADPGTERTALEGEVDSAAEHVRGELLAAMVDEGVPEHAAERALETDGSTAEDALLLANGTVLEEAVRAVDGDAVDRDRLRLRLEIVLQDALQDPSARPPRAPTNETATAARRAFRAELERVAADGIQSAGERARKRALGKRMGALPAGLPLAPVPGYWYATGNVWYVEVAGTYERVAVRANRGGPTGAVTYLRNGRGSWLTHEGERRRLGTAERVSFRTETAVVIAVPPGKSGVGDTNGVPDERSPGWPP